MSALPPLHFYSPLPFHVEDGGLSDWLIVKKSDICGASITPTRPEKQPAAKTCAAGASLPLTRSPGRDRVR